MTVVHVLLVTAVVFACVLPTVFGVPALLSLPGNVSLLVFLDVHTGDNCTQPDWPTFELALSLLWKHEQGNSSNGLEIYDTCGSGARVLEILRARMVTSQNPSPSVAGIISYTKPDIAQLISDSVQLYGTLHVSLGARAQSSPESSQQSNDLRVDFLSAKRITVLFELLQKLQWSYVTTMSDGGQFSEREHASFLSMATYNDICVQYSQSPRNTLKIDLVDIKTPGVIVFASDVEFVKHISQQLSTSKAVIVMTSNPAIEYSLIQDGIVISENYSTLDDFAKFMSSQLWKQHANEQILKDFHQNHLNCSYNTSVDALTCHKETDIARHFLKTPVALQMNILGSVYDLVTMTTEEMLKANCVELRWTECINMDDVIVGSKFSWTDGKHLSLKSTSLELRKVKGGEVLETGSFIIPDSLTFSADLATWLSSTSHPFPSSQCKTWCPICHAKSCDQTSQIKYTESHYVIPGDILLLGLFPLSNEWNENGGGQCSGIPDDKNTDVLVESFLYAIKTFNLRNQEFLRNVTVGAIIVDTCSNPRKALQLYMNFESCLYDFSRIGNNWSPSPYITPASVTVTTKEQKPIVAEILEQKKMRLIIDETGNINEGKELIYETSIYNFDTVVKILHQMKWTSAGVIRSNKLEQFDIEGLYDMARAMNVCIDYNAVVTSGSDNIYNVISTVIESAANTVVVFATSDDVDRLFRALTSRQVVKSWIIIETRKDIMDISAYPVPLGTIFVKKRGTQNYNFNSHVATVYTNSSDYDQNPWKQKFDFARETCSNCKYPDLISNKEVLTQASDVIKGVDITLAAINGAYRTLCPGSAGLCSNFWNDGASRVIENVNNVKLDYLDEKIDLAEKKQNENFIIYNLQKSGVVEVGKWTDSQLILDNEKVKSYSSIGVALEQPRESYCYTVCHCLNLDNVTEKGSDVVMFSNLDAEMGYTDSSAQFDSELWSIIVVIIAGTGSLLTVLLMVYIMCKVCSGALVRRYLLLGILLLVAMIFLFMSVLPFVFTPSGAVCGMRFFAHGFSYALSFAIILTKMTTLRDYRYIGLGGEISRINQLLSVLFITGVQIAVGVQWWVTRNPVVYSQIAFETDNRNLVQKTYYACDFERSDFIAYHSYVIFLIAMCCVYAISVRKETKNMKEARLLLISSWFCLAIWIALIVTVLTLDRVLLEAVCAIGLLATAVTMMVVIYLPKLTAISRLKYEVEQISRKENNGYKIDPDFQFERPYSLPGTMHSSITDKTLSYPRSLAAFDTSLSY